MRFKAIIIGTNELIEVVNMDDETYLCRTSTELRPIPRIYVQPLDARETE